jgi:type III secretory pathway component EscV
MRGSLVLLAVSIRNIVHCLRTNLINESNQRKNVILLFNDEYIADATVRYVARKGNNMQRRIPALPLLLAYRDCNQNESYENQASY